MSETIDIEPNISGKRGQTLKVLAILSWIAIGLSTVVLLFTIARGPYSAEEMDEQKVVLLSGMTDEMIEILGEDYVNETVMTMEVTNNLFYSIYGFSLAHSVLGFYAVFLMFNLKKRGFYLYLIYSIVPIFSTFGFYGMGTMMIFSVVFSSLISLLFCILYGYQLKRMS